jgi:hypothetical protein
MNAQTVTEAKATGKLAEVPAHRKLTGLVLFEATRFNHSDTVTAKKAGAMVGDDVRIVPARLYADGDWQPCKDGERPDGFGLEQPRGSGKERRLYRGFVTLSAVKELVYGE